MPRTAPKTNGFLTRGRRATRLRLSLRGASLSVTFRRFRTVPDKRSRLKRQKVYRLPTLPFKEVCFQVETRRTRTRRQPAAPRLRFTSVLLSLGGLAGAVYFADNLYLTKAIEPPAAVQGATAIREQTETKPAQPAVSRSVPTSLFIERVGMTATIVPVGLDQSGSVSVPGPDVAGWYSDGVSPGEIGPAVIVGHVDWIDRPAVFTQLRELSPGDVINVERQDGQTVRFKVDNIGQFSQADFPNDLVYGAVPHAGLRLITCGGVYDQSSGRYSENTVVFASMIE